MSVLRPRAVAFLVVCASWLASADEAHAYCRTRTDPVGSDDCAAKGPSLYWENQCVTYTVNKAGSAKAEITKARSIIAAAFAPWTAKNGVCTPGVKVIELTPTDTSTVGYDKTNPGANENVIVFRDKTWPYNDAGNPLALTTVTFNAENGEILDADIEVNTADKGVTSQEPLPPTGYDLQSIITHEAGHFLGLAHSKVGGSTMEPRYDRGQTGLRTLENDDQRGICAIYPSSDQRTSDETGGVSPITIKALACSTSPPTPSTATATSPGGCSCRAVGVGSGLGLSDVALAAAVLAGITARSRRRRA